MEHQIQPSESVALAIFEAVSHYEDCPPEALPPLPDELRCELEQLFEPDDDRSATDQIVSLTVEYITYHVTIYHDGTISVQSSPVIP